MRAGPFTDKNGLDRRKALGLTQAELAEPELTKSFISQIENGRVSPSLKALEFIAGKLGQPVSYFLEDTKQDAARERAWERLLEAALDRAIPVRQRVTLLIAVGEVRALSGEPLPPRQVWEGIADELEREGLYRVAGEVLSFYVRHLPQEQAGELTELLLRANELLLRDMEAESTAFSPSPANRSAG